MNDAFLAHHLKELRLAKHYTQSYVSSQIHLARSSYSNYESGLRTPTLDILVSLASFYNISIDDLIGLNLYPNHTIRLSPDERYLVSVYRALPQENQKEMISFADFKKQAAAK